jgi:hypothetical protein
MIVKEKADDANYQSSTQERSGKTPLALGDDFVSLFASMLPPKKAKVN